MLTCILTNTEIYNKYRNTPIYRIVTHKDTLTDTFTLTHTNVGGGKTTARTAETKFDRKSNRHGLPRRLGSESGGEQYVDMIYD